MVGAEEMGCATAEAGRPDGAWRRWGDYGEESAVFGLLRGPFSPPASPTVWPGPHSPNRPPGRIARRELAHKTAVRLEI